MAEERSKQPEVDEAQMMRHLREELQNLSVSDHLLFMMHSLSALAVERMGLTGEEGGRRDLDEARLAIDAFKALIELLERTRPAEEMTAHRSALSQLQLAYVGALSSGTPPVTPGAQPMEDRTTAGAEVGDDAGAEVGDHAGEEAEPAPEDHAEAGEEAEPAPEDHAEAEAEAEPTPEDHAEAEVRAEAEELAGED